MEFIDLRAQYRALRPEIDRAIQSVLDSARFINGPAVHELEEKLAAYVGRKHCITCGNGTDALDLIYMAYGIGPGDAVFCPDITFIASVEPACLRGAAPVFCDIEPDTYNLSASSLEEQVRRVQREGKYRPRAVVAVDFLGNPAHWDEISAVCERYGLLLIEDAAQGTGACYEGKKCGAWGDIAATSFFPTKPLGCYGDGGAVFTDSDDTAVLLRSLKTHGAGPGGKYDNVRLGVNSRLDTIQAAVLLAKLGALDEEIGRRQQLADRYTSALSGKFRTPEAAPGGVSAYAQYSLLAENESQRARVLTAMKQADVPSLIYYPTPLHQLKAFAQWRDEREFPNAEHYARCNFALPFSPYMTREEQLRVIDVVTGAP